MHTARASMPRIRRRHAIAPSAPLATLPLIMVALAACGGAPPKAATPPPTTGPVVEDTGVPADRDARLERISQEEHAPLFATPAWQEALAAASATEPPVAGESAPKRKWRLAAKLENDFFQRGVCQLTDDDVLEQRRFWVRMIESPRLVCAYENETYVATAASVADVFRNLSDEDLHAAMRFRAKAATFGVNNPTTCDAQRTDAASVIEEGNRRATNRIRPKDAARLKEFAKTRKQGQPVGNEEHCFAVRIAAGSALGLNPAFRAKYFRALLVTTDLPR